MSILNKISWFFKKNNLSTAPKVLSDANIHGYVGKFVKHDGSDIGESIAVENDRIVVKNSGIFMSIPLEKIVTNGENIVVGDFDREEALKLGKEWFDRKDPLEFDEKGMLIK